MSNLFKNRTFGAYIGLLSALLALGTALSMCFYGQAVKDFLPISFVLILVGVAAQIVEFGTALPLLHVGPGVCYVVAWGLYLKRELMTISNYFNKITLGNSGSTFQVIITFLILILIAVIVAVISGFFQQKKA